MIFAPFFTSTAVTTSVNSVLSPTHPQTHLSPTRVGKYTGGLSASFGTGAAGADGRNSATSAKTASKRSTANPPATSGRLMILSPTTTRPDIALWTSASFRFPPPSSPGKIVGAYPFAQGAGDAVAVPLFRCGVIVLRCQRGPGC